MPKSRKLFYLSNLPKIKLLAPSAVYLERDDISADLIIAYEERFLPHYLVPAYCRHFSYFTGLQTTDADQHFYFGNSSQDISVVVESSFYNDVHRSSVFCYEMPASQFQSYDSDKGIYISEKPVKPVSAKPVYNVIEEILKRNAQLLFTPAPLFNNLFQKLRMTTLKYVYQEAGMMVGSNSFSKKQTVG